MNRTELKNKLNELNIFHTKGWMYSDNEVGMNRHHALGENEVNKVFEVLSQVKNFDWKVVIDSEVIGDKTYYFQYLVQNDDKICVADTSYIDISYINDRLVSVRIAYNDIHTGGRIDWDLID